MKKYYVYILTNKNHTVLYTGFTDDNERRVYEHKNKILKGFTSKYNIDKLVYFEEFKDISKNFPGHLEAQSLQPIHLYDPGSRYYFGCPERGNGHFPHQMCYR